jgi:hypothetical protein
MDNKESFSENHAIGFKDLVMGFSGAALHYLGETKASSSKDFVINLPLARQNIELISLLFDKTQGNLTKEEEALIQQVLLDLKMRFIEKSKSSR